MKIEIIEKAKGCVDGINVTEFEPGHYETGEDFPESLALGFIQQGKAKKNTINKAKKAPKNKSK